MIYLDHHAATPPSAAAREAMAEARAHAWANPASAHAGGRAARRFVERAREQLAAAIGASPADLVFTSGGTEACHLGALGLGDGLTVSTEIEHPAVIGALEGREVRAVAVPAGRAPEALPLEGAALVCVQWVNHETGSTLPVEGWAQACATAGVPLFVDATAALGKLPVDVAALGASAVAFASSKIGGPLGAGALWIARDAALAPQLRGGGQERGRRAGTPDAVAIAGFGAAAAVLERRLAAMPAVAARRDRLENALVEEGATVNGEGARVATVSNVSVPGWKGPRLVAALDVEGLQASAGAACSSGVEQPSPVIAAMYAHEPWRAESSLRLSLGPETSDDDVDGAITILRRVLARKRS